MTAQQPLVQPCAHCGLPSEEPVVHDDLVFCCNGCLRVYELLTEPQCPVPGTAPTERSYAFLDVAEHGEKFIRRDAEGHARAVFFLPDMSCASCVQFLEQLHRKHEAILRSEVNFPRKEVRVLFDDKGISLGAVATLLSQSGYPPEVRSEAQTGRKKDYRLVTRIGVAGFCFGNIMLMSFPEYLGAGHLEESFRNAFGWLNMILSIPIVAYSGRGYLSSAYAAFRNRTVNIDVPITIGIIALFGRSSWEIITGYGAGYFDSLAGLIFFLLIGKWYQQRTYGALSYERDYKSYFPIAVLKREPGANRFVAISELRPGDEVIIHHREIVPADCTLISGDARIDYSFVTGESDPIRIAEGEAIQAGGRQTGGAIVALVRKPVEQSRLTRLWNSDAFKKEANDSIQDPVDRISKYFTWVVVSIALGAFIFWYPRNPSVAWNALAATLIVACPCALALTLPFTFGSIMRLMGKSGLYLKNAGVIEVMARIRHLVFDKTGTLTRANDYQLTWHGVAMSDAEQRAVSAVAAQSAHPLSRAIHQRLSASDALVEQFEETTGKGVSARVNGSTIRLGSRTWVDAPINDTRGSQVHLNIDGSYVGYFSFEKPLRGGLSNELARLGRHFDLHLISGDNSGDRERFSSFFSGLRMHFNQQPEDKMDYIKGLSELAPVAMVGDGLNDAGALKAADFGVAVVDDLYAFSPACDAILHADRLQHFDRFMGLSRSAMRIVKRSFGISFLYNAIGISFAVQGLLTPLVAAILMPLSSVTIVVFTVVSAHYYASKHGLSAR